MPENLWTEQLGVEVWEHKLRGIFGAYIHSHRLVVIDPQLAPVQRRSTLMHELGHAYYGHDATHPRWEKQASLWAASQLIRFCEYQQAIRVHSTAVGIAHELGVLPRDVSNYQQYLHSGIR